MNDVVNEANRGGRKTSLLVLIAIIILAAIGAGAWFYFEKDATTNTPTPAANDEVVARVDGVEISRAAYERNLQQLRGAYTSQGIDVSSATSSEVLKEQAINALINRQIIIAAAKAENIAVDTGTIDTEYKNIVEGAGGAEALASALAATGVTDDMVRKDIEEGLIIQQYLATKVGINSATVSEEEVKNYYEAAKKENAEVPAFEEVSEAIKNQLLAQKQEAMINAALEKLRADAKIEILI